MSRALAQDKCHYDFAVTDNVGSRDVVDVVAHACLEGCRMELVVRDKASNRGIVDVVARALVREGCNNKFVVKDRMQPTNAAHERSRRIQPTSAAHGYRVVEARVLD